MIGRQEPSRSPRRSAPRLSGCVSVSVCMSLKELVKFRVPDDMTIDHIDGV